MAEVLVKFDAILRDANGKRYVPKACGRPIDEGRRWEGWIEFVSADGEAIRTAQETVQPNRDAILYWATGLTAAYLEGALERATSPLVIRPNAVHDTPAFTEPAARVVVAPPPRPAVRPLLDPFEVYTQGEEVLRRELLALDSMHLRNIATAYGLADQPSEEPEMAREYLAGLIVAGVRDRVKQATHSPPAETS